MSDVPPEDVPPDPAPEPPEEPSHPDELGVVNDPNNPDPIFR